jgi:hypothetical protein
MKYNGGCISEAIKKIILLNDLCTASRVHNSSNQIVLFRPSKHTLKIKNRLKINKEIPITLFHSKFFFNLIILILYKI